MIDKLEYLEDGEFKYPMAFTVNVMESIEGQYGGLQLWIKQIDKSEPSYKAIKFMLLEVINEGLDIQGTDKKLNSKEVGRLITKIGFEEIGLKLFNLMKESLPKGDASKNKIPMQKEDRKVRRK